MTTYDAAEVEDIYQNLLCKATRGTKPQSMAAPSLATEFVKSRFRRKAQPNADGALAEIIIPTQQEVEERNKAKHPTTELFGYRVTAASDAFPAGYGERSANALAKEDQTFQLKGSFIAASVAMSKLRARVEARQGDPDAINRIFAKLWGLSEEQANMVPHLHISGSEATRMAAMEDRAYHSLAGHPAYSGGYRVDLASLAPDALGDDVPMNWPRLRTGLKAIANMQVNADLEMMTILEASRQPTVITMDLTRASQKKYMRTAQWESALDYALRDDDDRASISEALSGERTIAGAITRNLLENQEWSLFQDPEHRIRKGVGAIAELVKENARANLDNVVRVIMSHSEERQLLESSLGDEYEELSASQMAKSFDVPRYKLTRTSLKRGLTKEDRNPDKLPDMSSRGPKAAKLDMQELRSAGMLVPIDIPSVLNLATYLTVNKMSLAVPAYKLVTLVKDPNPKGSGKVSVRLRSPKLYESEDIRQLGGQLFAEDFMSIFDTLCSNMTHSAKDRPEGIKMQLWEYLCKRTGGYRNCPVLGDWRDLITYLRTAPEGWTLYYWARVSMGKLHYAVGNDILAPIAAGEEADFLTLMRKSVQARAKHWAAYYTAQAQLISGELDEHKKKVKEKRRQLDIPIEPDPPDDSERIRRYIPPHLRKYAHLEYAYDDDEILGRRRGYTREQYRRMVEMQSKAKFFRCMVVASKSRQLSVGISDTSMRDVIVEFYQARWYSLHKRIERAKATKTAFYLGKWLVEEHPWGELATQFPKDLQGMLDFCAALDPRAWTVPMHDLWVKFNKSLTELWQDVSTELQRIQEYIGDVHDCLADTQVETDAKRRVESVLRSMSDVTAIPIPVSGYIPTYRLPERHLSIEATSSSDPIDVVAAPLDHVDVEVLGTDQDEEMDEGGQLDEDEDEEVMDFRPSVGSQSNREIHVQISRYLTYNEIWLEMSLPEVKDEVKRAAFGLPVDVRVADQHLDSKYGPIILYEEAHRAAKAWAKLKGGILKRMGQGVRSIRPDDM